MSKNDQTDDESDFSRRTFMKASGAVAGAGFLGTGAMGSAAADDSIPLRFMNPRVQEAAQAWERGYRGRADRTVALTDTGGDARHPAIGPWNGVRFETEENDDEEPEFRFVIDGEDADGFDDDRFPEADDMPEMVGWNPANRDRWGVGDIPRDENSHGTHVSGTMTATGRTVMPNPDKSEIRSPQAILIPGQVLDYEVDAQAGTNIFVSAYGQAIELAIEGPNGKELAFGDGLNETSEERLVNNILDAPTVHDEGEATYTVYVRAQQGEALPARVEEVAFGASLLPEETAGDVDGDDGFGFHSGYAPGSSLVSIAGLGTGLSAIAATDELADEFVSTFNARALNMSWGYLGGDPSQGQIAGIGDDADVLPALRNAANNGLVPVASAGNDATPATGDAPPTGANEAIATVATGDLDGIAAYSSGGLGAVDDETNEPYFKPDITAPGGSVTALEISAMPGEVDSDAEFGDVRGFDGKGGTSMAAPSVTGMVSALAQALEEDAPESISLPEPADAERKDAMRLKQIMLSTASETALTAAPYHNSRGNAPVYTFGDRDPHEGFGRANVGAAIDSVTRDLLPGTEDVVDDPDEATVENTVSDFVGLNVPRDQRAAAGFVTVRGGELEVDLEFSHYGGGNSGMPKGDPHIDLFVYDYEDVDTFTGEPEIVASAQGLDGDASVSVDLDAAENQGQDFEKRTLAVVAKIVNVPGVVNGFDVQAHFDLGVRFEAEEIEPVPPEEINLDPEGDRDTGSSVFTGGQPKRVTITLDDFNEDAAESVHVTDEFPEEWEFGGGEGEVTGSEDGRKTIDFGVVEADEVDDGAVDFTYFVQAPDDLEDTGQYTFGPATAEIEEATELGENEERGTEEDEQVPFTGENDAVLLGQGT